MIVFKLTRQEAQFICDAWMGYMVQVAETRMINNAGRDGSYLQSMMIASLIDEVYQVFKRKLLNRAATSFKFSLQYHYGIAFYFHLHTQPVPTAYVWENLLRQRLCNELHQQLFCMRPPVHENIPLTIEDYYADFM